MPARAISSATVSFGLVSIPIKVYSAHETANDIHFNMLHAECGTRLKQQYICPTHDRVVSRDETARGYEFAKGQYVLLSDDEYKALLEVADNTIALTEFVPAKEVDPVYFERTYYLGPDKGGERAYRLIIDAMLETGLVGLAKYSARGKQYLVLVRPFGKEGLVMHQLHYADEVKSFDEVPIKEGKPATAAEVKLAVQLIEQIAEKKFAPEKYEDEVKGRMLELIENKVQGEEITAQPEPAPQAQVIDLMEALRKSLGMGGEDGAEAAGEGEGRRSAKKAPAARGKAAKDDKEDKADKADGKAEKRASSRRG
ncbi:MAG TPA: Ku protein [Kofleriaceae bacterium]|nr:Ku protein [Kofleriaceae bacterium]